MKSFIFLGILAYVVHGNINIKVVQKINIGCEGCDGEHEHEDNKQEVETTTALSLDAANAALAQVEADISQLEDSLSQAQQAASVVQSAGTATNNLISSAQGSGPGRHRRESSNYVSFTSCNDPTAMIQGTALNVTLQVIQGILDEVANIATILIVDKLNCFIGLANTLTYKFNDGSIPSLDNDTSVLQQLANQLKDVVTTSTASIAQQIEQIAASLEAKKTEQASLQQQIQSLGGTVDGTTEASTPVTPNPEMYSDCLSLIQKSIVLRKCPFSSPPSTDTFSKRIFGENCWSTQKSISIISSGNNNASLEEYSYNVGILVGESRESIYGGSVLSSTWILTAAHILHNRSDSMLMTHVYVEHKKVIDVSRYFLHPNFQICPNSFENDIALLELCEPIEYTFPAIKPLCFSTVSEDLASTSAMTTDWVSASEYTEVVLNIISKEKCAEQLMSKGLSTPRNKNTFFCTYTDSEDTCLYKDGGPVVAEVSPGDWIQLGVTSRGYNCSNADTPRVHMDVTAFKDWIVNTTKIRPVYESEMYQECPISTDSPTTPLQNSTNQASSQCPVETLLGDKCWSGDAANQRIIGGQNASRQYPYQVALYLNGRFSCGGSIISSSWIMTAAHCVVDDCGSWSGNQSVRYGSSYHSQGKTAYVKRIIVHQNYTSRNYPTYYDANDIALMELCQPLDFSTPEVQPICLSAKPTQNENTVIATGWGSLRCDDDDLMPEYLQEVTLNVSSNEECQKIFQSYYTGNSEIPLPPDNNTYVCSTNKDEDTGHGDSGGPIVTRLFTGCWVQLGITSYGFDCDRKPGVYTRVSAFKDWICEQTKLC